MYQIEVDWSPAYEILTGLQAYLAGSEVRVLDQGASWREEVDRRLSPDLRDQLLETEIVHLLDPLVVLAWQCPRKATVSGYLGWLRDLSTGEALERLVSHLSDSWMPSIRRVVDGREHLAGLLEAWQQAYLATVDPRVLPGLREEAERMRFVAATADPVALVEEVTNGLYLEPNSMPSQIVVGPQYGLRPLNLVNGYSHLGFILYAFDPLPTLPGRPSTHLLRLARALADESRLRILYLLSLRPRTYTEVSEETGLARSTAHYHLSVLRTAGVVRVHQTGDVVPLYSLRPTAAASIQVALESFLTRGKE